MDWFAKAKDWMRSLMEPLTGDISMPGLTGAHWPDERAARDLERCRI
jgi:hypothetical protein